MQDELECKKHAIFVDTYGYDCHGCGGFFDTYGYDCRAANILNHTFVSSIFFGRSKVDEA